MSYTGMEVLDKQSELTFPEFFSTFEQRSKILVENLFPDMLSGMSAVQKVRSSLCFDRVLEH